MRKISVLLAGLFLASCNFGDSGNSDPAPDPLPVSIPSDIMGMVHAGDFELLETMGVVWMLSDFSWDGFEPAPPTYREAMGGKSAGDRWKPADGVTPAILANLDHHWNENYKVDYLAGVASHPSTRAFAVMAYDTPWIHPEGSSDNHVSAEMLPLYREQVKTMVKKLYRDVGVWNIWNEPDNRPRFWTGTDEEFYALTKTAALAIREVETELNVEHPDENIHLTITGGAFFSGASPEFIRGMFEYDKGIIKTTLDAVAFHPYSETPQSVTKAYNDFKAIVTPYGFGDKIWVTEEGYPSGGYYPWTITEAELPEKVVKTLTLLATQGAGHIFWYHLFDSKKYADATPQEKADAEKWFGLVVNSKVDGKYVLKQGANAYALWAKYIPGYTYRPTLPKRSGLSADIQSFYFEKDDGKRTLILWNDKDASLGVTVILPGNSWLLHDPAEREFESADGTNRLAPPAGIDSGGKAVITLSKTPLILTWNAGADPLPPRISAP
ncbi:hypothetical protein AGMMS4952_21580 [Spirochaetia bacterium]|nr:hypothetical protein AGMMS4952_21580 [Spirochaetia bacterium]